jgi:hypothetical protein
MSTDHEARLEMLSRAYRMMRADMGDMTAEQIRAMPMSEFAKLRATVLGDEADPTPTRPTVAPVDDEPRGTYAEDMPEHMGVPDFERMGMDEYRAVRNRYIRPTTARGIFD